MAFLIFVIIVLVLLGMGYWRNFITIFFLPTYDGWSKYAEQQIPKIQDGTPWTSISSSIYRLFGETVASHHGSRLQAYSAGKQQQYCQCTCIASSSQRAEIFTAGSSVGSLKMQNVD